MRVLLTGAFGNVGIETIDELLAAGHEVRAFELASKRNEEIAAGFGSRIEVVWGDLRWLGDIRGALAGCDAVIHDAAIIPPVSEKNPDLTRAVNVGGTQHVIEVCEEMDPSPRLVFASSVTVTGPRQDEPPPRRASDPVAPTDHYTRSKVRCEEMLRDSSLDWIVLRLGAVLPLRLAGSAELDLDHFFSVNPGSRVETVHPADVGLAQTRALTCDEAVHQTLLIGGGADSQLHLRDLNAVISEGVGLGPLPDAWFSKEPYYTDWMDTEPSQRLLEYQRHDFATWADTFRAELSHIRRFVRPFRWPIRKFLEFKSPHSS